MRNSPIVFLFPTLSHVLFHSFVHLVDRSLEYARFIASMCCILYVCLVEMKEQEQYVNENGKQYQKLETNSNVKIVQYHNLQFVDFEQSTHKNEHLCKTNKNIYHTVGLQYLRTNKTNFANNNCTNSHINFPRRTYSFAMRVCL